MEKLTMDLQKYAAEQFDGLLSKGTVLSYSKAEVETPIAAVKSIPAIGSDPEKVDVTHLGSGKKSYIPGLQDSENLEFAIVYQGSNFNDIHALVSTGKSQNWTITYPDGLKAKFKGIPSYKFDGAEVNAAIGFSLVVVVSDGPDFTPKA